MILYISDFDLSGSGYMRIGTNLCNQLVTRHEMGVIALGLGYDGREHFWPFSITPCQHLQQIPAMVSQIRGYGAPVEAVVVALDIPLQEALLKSLKRTHEDPPYIGIFPLEAGPLCLPWAMELMKMDERLVMSRFGGEELAMAGVTSHFIPIGINDPENWRPPTPEERTQIRQGLGWDEDTFIVLTVADNQERKNLASAMQIFADFAVNVQERNRMGLVTKKRDKRKTQWHLVTRVDSPVGWKLDDLAMRLGVMDKVATYRRGVPPQSLWAMFAGADCFLLTSKAEGLAIPVMEAMAVRLPVVATDAGAMAEHLADGRGLLIEPEYRYTDPFGNGERLMASIPGGVKKLERLADDGPGNVDLDAAYEYVMGRTWEKAGVVLAEAIKRIAKVRIANNGKTETQAAQIPESIGAVA